MNIVVDFLREPLEVGDLVLRSIYSTFTFHRIVKINKKSIGLSSGFRTVEYSNGRSYRYRTSATSPELVDLNEFNGNTNINAYIDRSGRAISIIKFNRR